MLNSNEKQRSLQVLSFGAEQGMPIRMQVINSEAWFVAKDVCQALDISNHNDAISRLEDDEKGVGNTDTLGGVQTMVIVNESGLYHLIFQSRKPEARKFRKWVTGEVLPQIRKTGSYSSPVRKILLPRERSMELGDFYRELRQWVTHDDERAVASLMNVTRDHVHRVLVGGKPSYGVLCMLVDCAKDNRKAGRRRAEITAAGRKVQVEQLRLEFMEGKEAEDGTL